MPDITMCADKECPMRKTCYRYTARPHDLWQSWFSESPRNGQELGEECSQYWERS